MKKYVQKKWQEYNDHAELKKIVANINWLFLDKAIQMGVAFFVGIWVIRYLGPERYGVLSYAVAMVAFFSILAKLGLDAIAVRELVDAKFPKEKIMGTIFHLKALGGVGAVFLASVVSFAVSGDEKTALITLAVAFSLIFQATDVIDFWFQSRVASKYVAIARSSAYIVSALVKIVLILTNASLVWFAWVISLEAFLVGVGLIVAFLVNSEKLTLWKFDLGVARALLRDAWPLILSAVSVMIYMRIDQVMIGNMIGYEALGQYSVAVGLSEMWYFIPTIITASVFPAIIVTKKRDEKLYYARLQKLYDMMVWLAVAIALPMTFLSGWIIQTLYGAEYAQAGSVLSIYIWGSIFSFFGTARGKWLVAENLQKFSFYYLSLGAFINVVLNIFLIKIYGINGAAVSTVFSLASIVLLFPLLTKKVRKSVIMFFGAFNIKKYLQW